MTTTLLPYPNEANAVLEHGDERIEMSYTFCHHLAGLLSTMDLKDSSVFGAVTEFIEAFGRITDSVGEACRALTPGETEEQRRIMGERKAMEEGQQNALELLGDNYKAVRRLLTAAALDQGGTLRISDRSFAGAKHLKCSFEKDEEYRCTTVTAITE